MTTVWTRHAVESLAERKIERAWVERVIAAPDWREPDPRDMELERLFGIVPEAGGKTMRVVVGFEAEDRCRVVTFFFDRDARGA